MKEVKLIPKLKKHYIECGYVSTTTPINTMISIHERDYRSNKSFKTFNVWMLLESKPFKKENINLIDVDLQRLEEVADFIGDNLDTKKYLAHSSLRRIAHFVKYDVDGSYLDRFLAAHAIPPNQRTDTLSYLVLCYGETEGRDRFEKKRDIRKGKLNPAFDHSGTLSPFSKKFVGYKDISEEDTTNVISKLSSQASSTAKANGNAPTNIEYYIKRGMALPDAQAALSERQTTFSREKCVTKYGIGDGTQRWLDRQEKWQTTLNNKSEQEKKSWYVGKSSKLELALVSDIKTHIPNISTQLSMKRDDMCSYYLYDISYHQKIIEFNSDYWHMNPTKYHKDTVFRNGMIAEDVWRKDESKLQLAKDKGYEVLVIWETDYRNNKQQVIEECVNFLNK